MATWAEGVEALEGNGAPVDIRRRHWLPWISRTPILITGAAGSGKTEMWRQLTGREAPDAMSSRPDEGYFFAKASGKQRIRRKRSMALTTIPGQPSKNRYDDMNWFFGPNAVLDGVVFVATFGFNHVWPKRADAVANQLASLDIETLSAHNIDLELDSFRTTCDRIQEKRTITGAELGPRWVLVLVNKVDLYWDGLTKAEEYYKPGSATPFDAVARSRLPVDDPLADFEYRVLPVTLHPRPFRFSSNGGPAFETESQLDSGYADRSLGLLVKTLEDLCGI